MIIEPDFLIDCSLDFDPDIDLERKGIGTGEPEAYSGIGSVTGLLSTTRRSSTPIHASLSQSFVERASKPGRIHPATPFNVDDLRTHLIPTYARRFVYLNLFKSGELLYEPFRCLVLTDRLEPARG